MDGTWISHTSVAEIAKLVFLTQWRFLAGISISTLIKSSGSCMPWQSDIPGKCEVHVHIPMLMEGTKVAPTELRGERGGGRVCGVSARYYLTPHVSQSDNTLKHWGSIRFTSKHWAKRAKKIVITRTLKTKPFQYPRGSKCEWSSEEQTIPIPALPHFRNTTAGDVS